MDHEWLIGEVAKRHGVVLQKADPLFLTVTLNELVLGEYIEQVNAAVLRVHAQALTACAQEAESAKTASAASLGRAGSYAAGQVRAAGIAVREELSGVVKTQIDAMAAEVASARRYRRQACWCAVVAAAAAGMIVGGALARVVGH